MSEKHIRKIAAIIALALLASPIIIILIDYNIQNILNSWQTQPQVMTARMRYQVINWILGIVASIVIAKVAPIVFDRLSRFNKKYLSIFGICSLLLLGIFFLSVGQHTVLYCERIKDTCSLTRTGLWWSKNEQFSLQNLQGAYVRVDNSGDSTTEQVAIVTSQGDILMTDLSYSPGWQSETARQINDFVMKPDRKSLQVYEDDRWISITMGIIITLVSIVVLVFVIN
jgi:hypothetical protein